LEYPSDWDGTVSSDFREALHANYSFLRVAVSNLVLATFLSLKNTPLAFLTTYSYERLNILHQVAGYSTVFWVLLHAVVYIIAWKKTNNLHELLETSQIVGITAGFAFLIILGTALFLRKLRYEVFYIVHIVMFMLILVLVGMHRPDFPKKTIIVVIFTAAIWVADRAFRFAKISFFSIGNTATITPLPHGGTRIVLRKSPSRAVSGSHCFLWVPTVRAAETHPFTIVSAKPLEFVIASYDGFTRDLYARALKHPGEVLKASIDGPYGVVPDFTAFTKVLFIAGGSGASFSLGVAADLIRKLGDSSNTTIEVLWVIREQGI
jgi:predicted ferric reductase